MNEDDKLELITVLIEALERALVLLHEMRREMHMLRRLLAEKEQRAELS